MSEFSFTPGPWEVRVIGKHKIRMVYPVHEDGPRGFICDDVPNEANANLIAAAPDLYRELEQVTDALVRYVPMMEFRLRVAHARDALAKARGEEVDDE